MNTHNAQSSDASNLPAWADWSDAPPLSTAQRHAQDRTLATLRRRATAKRRARTATRVLVAAMVVVAAMTAARGLWSAPPTTTTPTPPIAHTPAPTSTPAPAPSTPGPSTVETSAPRPLAIRVAYIETDPTIAARYAFAPASTAVMLDDDGLARELERAGMPGVIRIGGRVLLSRDLHQPPENHGPRSDASPGHDQHTAS